MKFLLHKTNKTIISLSLILLSLLAFPTQTYAQSWSGLPCNNSTDEFQGPAVATAADGGEVATLRGIECLFTIAINYAIGFIGIGIIVMIVIGAYRILMSGGDPKSVAAGQGTITYAVLGLILAIASWLILNLIQRITGAQILTFSIFSGTP